MRTAALPLLQPELRSKAKGPLQAAAKALEAVSSPLQRLRAQLHLELARCEVADDGHVKVGSRLMHHPHACCMKQRPHDFDKMQRSMHISWAHHTGIQSQTPPFKRPPRPIS